MIIGAMSENLLLLILQKLDELYREMMAGRSEGTNANRLENIFIHVLIHLYLQVSIYISIYLLSLFTLVHYFRRWMK